jgi:transcriptional regulator with XRE-family HTH domain
MAAHSPDAIRAMRRRAGLTQETFAAVLGVSLSAVNQWERGLKTPTGLSRLALANFGEWLAEHSAPAAAEDRSASLSPPAGARPDSGAGQVPVGCDPHGCAHAGEL